MKELCQKLETWGCDVNGALERFVNDEDLYLSCLKTFSDDEGFGLIKESLSRQNYYEVFDHAHKLKGVSANLGLTPLYTELSQMVVDFRAGDYDKLEDQYEKVMEQFNVYRGFLKEK